MRQSLKREAVQLRRLETAPETWASTTGLAARPGPRWTLCGQPEGRRRQALHATQRPDR